MFFPGLTSRLAESIMKGNGNLELGFFFPPIKTATRFTIRNTAQHMGEYTENSIFIQGKSKVVIHTQRRNEGASVPQMRSATERRFKPLLWDSFSGPLSSFGQLDYSI